MSKKIIYTILFISLVILAGYLRETFFVRIIWCEAALTKGAFIPKSLPIYKFLEHLTIDQLHLAKYIGTIIFVSVFWLLSLLMIKLFFNAKKNHKTIHLIFAMVFSMSLIIYSIGIILPFKIELYNLSRWILGLIETPLIIVLLFPVFWIQSKTIQLKKGN